MEEIKIAKKQIKTILKKLDFIEAARFRNEIIALKEKLQIDS